MISTRRSQLETLRAHPGVEELRIRTPSLEEIFVAYLKLAEPAAEPLPCAREGRQSAQLTPDS